MKELQYMLFNRNTYIYIYMYFNVSGEPKKQRHNLVLYYTFFLAHSTDFIDERENH